MTSTELSLKIAQKHTVTIQNKSKQYLSLFLFSDFVLSILSWSIFYIYRETQIEKLPLTFDNNFFLGILIIPIFWLIFFATMGMYQKILRRHRLQELSQVFRYTFIGVVVIFFMLIINDVVDSYFDYYRLFLVYYLSQFTLLTLSRLLITSQIISRVNQRKIKFNTIMVGTSDKAFQTHLEMVSNEKSYGNHFVGYIKTNESNNRLSENLPCLGKIDDLHNIITDKNIHEVIIAVEPSEREKLSIIVNELIGYDVTIKMIPDMYDILSGHVKTNGIFNKPLITIKSEFMPIWEKNLKNFFDKVVSIFALLLLSPIFVILAVLVKLESKGSIFYMQERIGKNGNPFKIIKFRSMYIGSEKNGPQLAKDKDNRITKVGRFIRKTRLDEIPQFLNVLKGDMSLVGPRPERAYFINQIQEKAPYYTHLLKVKPGITGWGQVRFGYAENLDEMVQRLQFDILYIRNMSLILDLKILAYTALTVIKSEGK